MNPLSELSTPVPEALSVPCRGCVEPVGKPCRTPSGYVLEGTHDVRRVDVAMARARAAEAAHLSMVRKAGELRDERDRLREALEEYRLWEPGKRGHAAAHRRLFAALNHSEAGVESTPANSTRPTGAESKRDAGSVGDQSPTEGADA